MVLHVDATAATEGADVVFDGALEVDDSAVHVSAETSRRLACDAAVVRMHHDADGNVLDVGRKTRTIPAAIRRALSARDTRCQFPGCSARRCDAHHIEHWVDGGATSLDNLVLLCRRHHRLVHEGGFTLERQADGTVAFFYKDGAPLWTAPPPPRFDLANPLAPTTERLRGGHHHHPADAAHLGRHARSMSSMPSTCCTCRRVQRGSGRCPEFSTTTLMFLALASSVICAG